MHTCELSRIEAKQHMAFAIFHISKSIKPKILRFLLDIIYYTSNMPQKFHFIWSPTTIVMKKTNTTSIENLDT
jgi:hypothetical protein